jgi:hypothetical protein
MSMKIFTTLLRKFNSNKKLRFAKNVLIFYLLMMIIYGYFIFGNISTAPKFIYSEF